jgi:hypothetical protein
METEESKNAEFPFYIKSSLASWHRWLSESCIIITSPNFHVLGYQYAELTLKYTIEKYSLHFATPSYLGTNTRPDNPIRDQ